jgi:predicted Holliday junction resolvase-like endonuclease
MEIFVLTCLVVIMVIGIYLVSKITIVPKNKVIEIIETNKAHENRISNLVMSLDELGEENKYLKEDLISTKTKLDNVVNQKKSSEVRLGKIGENLAPFTDSWPWDSNSFRFLGSPIDGIQFTDDEIIFVEIKTGKSRLSNKQLRYKKLVEDKKVRFSVFRMGEGIEIT